MSIRIRSHSTGEKTTSRWRRLAVLPLAVLACVLAQVPAAPANADAASALRHCRNGAQPEINAWVELGGSSTGVSIPTQHDPPNILDTGDTFSVTSGGWVTVDWWGQGHTYGPGGNGSVASSGWPFPDNIQYSNVLRFNNKPTGWVGVPQQATQWGGCRQWFGPPVRLLFFVNDPGLGDNSGSWSTNVRIWQASAPE